jgi:Acyl-CoA dehydrogenase, C-terminal domain
VDYAYSPSELGHLQRLRGVAEAAGDPSDLLRIASRGAVLTDLEAAIAAPSLADSPLHERALVVEEAARLGLPALPGLRLLVGAEVLGPSVRGSVALVDRRRPGPARNGPDARVAIVLDGAEGWVADLTGRQVTPVDSSCGYPYADFATDAPDDGGGRLTASEVTTARSRWHLMLAAEIAGTASGALAHVTAYLRERRQFGQPLATFQALRHRMAELATSTEAALWLAREAAWHGDAGRAGVALSYARDLAAFMAPEVVQLCGARGFTTEFPAHLFAMRLEGLRLEVGSADRLARALSPAHPGAMVAGPA